MGTGDGVLAKLYILCFFLGYPYSVPFLFVGSQPGYPSPFLDYEVNFLSWWLSAEVVCMGNWERARGYSSVLYIRREVYIL
jgi:hypothetical protein